MDRFVVREPKIGADYPQGNQIIQFSPNSGNRPMIPETMYFGGYGAEFPVQRGSPGFMTVAHVNAPHFAPNLPSPNQVISGIDPRYLAAYADNSSNFIAGQRQQMERDQNPIPSNGPAFANDYQNRNFIGVDRSKPSTFAAHNMTPTSKAGIPQRKNSSTSLQRMNLPSDYQQPNSRSAANRTTATNSQAATKTTTTKEDEAQKSSIQVPVPLKTRAERIRELHKTGARAFSGPVEKVLKWHKALQELGVLVLYEIVAKCVSVRSGESCAKVLVVRDDSGPAMQVVYYEIDFLLPELKPPCTVRVVGRMMPGTCRLQAFTVRKATGDDVSTLPRRAAVAAHHISKLCKEFGQQ